MKSVLISIQPKWCELITSGKKTVEVRKTKPKLDVPFKVYIYCTKSGEGNLFKRSGNKFLGYHYEPLQGKVIGEFVCDWVKSSPSWRLKGNTGFCAKRTEREEMLPKMTCLSLEEIEKYAGSENRLVYGWHISNLVIYDKPRELSEFINCKYPWDCCACDYWDSIYLTCTKPIRPPQSWCYVESEVDAE